MQDLVGEPEDLFSRVVLLCLMKPCFSAYRIQRTNGYILPSNNYACRTTYFTYDLSRDARKLVIRVSDQVRHKPVCAARLKFRI